MRSLPFLFLLLCSPNIFGQNSGTRSVLVFEPYHGTVEPVAVDTPPTIGPHPGNVEIHADPKVEQLMRRYTEHKHPRKGYRVQIFLGDRRTAEDTKRAFLLKNPDSPAYLSWFAPNWRLRIGDLRTRLEAERMLHELRAIHPGCYIVPDEIEMPRLATAP
ncbi:MAG: SPOR domain-containing protein [Flavobacteriales bacterium]|nr:SPOR domain-containing protein [Flavobacteriales bacterium]